LKAFYQQSRLAHLSGNDDAVQSLAAHIKQSTLLTDEHKKSLHPLCGLASGPDKPGNKLLAKLQAASRDISEMDGQWSYSYSTANGSQVTGTMQLTNGSGPYQNDNGAGNGTINISNASPPPLGGGGCAQVSGQWQYYDGESGWF